MPFILGANSAADTVHSIDQSIRFNDDDSPFLTRTPSSAGNRRTWTFSCWLKRGNITSTMQLFNSGANDSNNSRFQINSDDVISYVHADSGSVTDQIKTNMKIRDTAAWYNIQLVADTTDPVDQERLRIYVNGRRITDLSVTDYPTKDFDTDINNTEVHNIGRLFSGTQYLDGYLAEIVLVDGQALYPSSFGEYNSSNIWIPKDVSGLTFGTNGFYLKGDDANNLGKDSSGNGNDFANTLHTFEPSQSNGSLSNGNLTTSFASVTNFRGGRGFVGKSSGKWYAEVTIDNRGTSGGNGRSSVGITRAASFGSDTSTNAARDSVGAFTYSREGAKEQGTGSGVTSTSTGYDSFSNSDVIGVALNMDDGEVYFYKNGNAQDSGTAAFTGLGSNTYDLIAIGFGGFQSTVNFGATAFSYTPPTGYAAWDTGSSALLPSDQRADTPTNNQITFNPLNNQRSGGTLSEGNLRYVGPGTRTLIGLTANVPSTGKWAVAYTVDQVSTTAGWQIGLSTADDDDFGDGAGSNEDLDIVRIQPNSSNAEVNDRINNSYISPSPAVPLTTSDEFWVVVDMNTGNIFLGIYDASDTSMKFIAADGGTDGDPANGTNPTLTATTAQMPRDNVLFSVCSKQTSQFINLKKSSELSGTTPTGFTYFENVKDLIGS